MGILDFYPAVSLLAPPWHVQPGYLSEIKNAAFRISFTWKGHKLYEERSVETPVGKISQLIIKDPSYGSDWVEKPYIKTREDYRIMQYVIENSVLASHESRIAQRMKDLGEDGVVLGRVDRAPYQKLLIELADPEQFLVDLYTDPGPATELMEAMDARMDEQFEMALDTGVEVIWQPDNITSDMIPPESFEKYCMPYYLKNGSKCREAGKVYAVHIDGRAGSLKEMLADTPIDIIESFSLPLMGGDLETAEALQAWPEKVICPNFPASLCTAGKDEILEFLEKLHADFGNRPYMLQLSEDFEISSYHNILKWLAGALQEPTFTY
jgi:hypothetical protein